MYFKITWVVAIQLEHMHKKFEINRIKIKGRKLCNPQFYEWFASSICAGVLNAAQFGGWVAQSWDLYVCISGVLAMDNEQGEKRTIKSGLSQ